MVEQKLPKLFDTCRGLQMQSAKPAETPVLPVLILVADAY
jgi:hypothetical protein